MTETDLAGRLGVSRQCVSLYELERQTPSPGILEEIAAIVSLPVEYFMAAPPVDDHVPAVWFRSLESTTRRAREAAKARLGWLVEIVQALEQDIALPAVDLPKVEIVDPSTLDGDDIERLAAEFRTAWGLGDDPIVDLISEMETRGVVVTRFSLHARQLDAFSCWASSGRPFVVVDDGRSAARQRLDLAHELGHLVLHRNTENTPENHDQHEAQAFRFGAAFLFPRRPFLKEVLPAATLSSLLIPKKRWNVSLKMLIYRAHGLHVISSERMKQLFKQYSSAGYARSGEPLDSSLIAESPTMLLRAFDEALKAGVIGRFLRSISLSAEEAETVCALPRGFMDAWLGRVPQQRSPQQKLFPDR